MSYKKHRCTECTLMRCDIPGTACEECMSNMGISPALSVFTPVAVDTSTAVPGAFTWTWASWPSDKP